MRRLRRTVIGLCFFTVVNAAAESPSISRVSSFGPGERFQVFGENLQKGTFYFSNMSLNEVSVKALDLDAKQVAGFEINGGYNLLEGNLSAGIPVGIKVRGDGEGNLLVDNRLEQARTPVIDETGQAVVVPPKGIQDYKAFVPGAVESAR